MFKNSFLPFTPTCPHNPTLKKILCKFIGVRKTYSTPGLSGTQVIRKRLKRPDCLTEENAKLRNAGLCPGQASQLVRGLPCGPETGCRFNLPYKNQPMNLQIGRTANRCFSLSQINKLKKLILKGWPFPFSFAPFVSFWLHRGMFPCNWFVPPTNQSVY